MTDHELDPSEIQSHNKYLSPTRGKMPLMTDLEKEKLIELIEDYGSARHSAGFNQCSDFDDGQEEIDETVADDILKQIKEIIGYDK